MSNINNMDSKKICSVCNIEKLYTEYSLRNNVPLGTKCKQCRAELARKKRELEKINKIEKTKEQNEIKQELLIKKDKDIIVNSDRTICNKCDKAVLNNQFPKTKDGKNKSKKCQECLNKEAKDRYNEVTKKDESANNKYYSDIPVYINYKNIDSISKYVYEIDDYLFRIENNNKIIMDNHIENEKYRKLVNERNNEIKKCMKNLSITKEEYNKLPGIYNVTKEIDFVKNNEVHISNENKAVNTLVDKKEEIIVPEIETQIKDNNKDEDKKEEDKKDEDKKEEIINLQITKNKIKSKKVKILKTKDNNIKCETKCKKNKELLHKIDIKNDIKKAKDLNTKKIEIEDEIANNKDHYNGCIDSHIIMNDIGRLYYLNGNVDTKLYLDYDINKKSYNKPYVVKKILMSKKDESEEYIYESDDMKNFANINNNNDILDIPNIKNYGDILLHNKITEQIIHEKKCVSLEDKLSREEYENKIDDETYRINHMIYEDDTKYIMPYNIYISNYCNCKYEKSVVSCNYKILKWIIKEDI